MLKKALHTSVCNTSNPRSIGSIGCNPVAWLLVLPLLLLRDVFVGRLIGPSDLNMSHSLLVHNKPRRLQHFCLSILTRAHWLASTGSTLVVMPLFAGVIGFLPQPIYLLMSATIAALARDYLAVLMVSLPSRFTGLCLRLSHS